MPTSFLSLPGEIRNEIYKYLVVQRPPICFYYTYKRWKRQSKNLEIDVKILYVNKTIHHEAGSLLYSLNYFDFDGDEETGTDYERLFDIIGHKNASLIQHLRIILPYIDDSKDGGIIRQGFIPTLDVIERVCTSLHTIELELRALWKALWQKDEALPDCPRYLTEGLALIDTRLRAIRSLRKIIAVYVDYMPAVDSGMKREIKSLGWEISVNDKSGTMYCYSL